MKNAHLHGFLHARAYFACSTSTRQDEFRDMMFKWWEPKEEPPQIDERRTALLKEILPSPEEIEELSDEDWEEEGEEDLPWTREELMGYSLPDLKQILLEHYILKKNTKEEVVSKILDEQAREEENGIH